MKKKYLKRALALGMVLASTSLLGVDSVAEATKDYITTSGTNPYVNQTFWNPTLTVEDGTASVNGAPNWAPDYNYFLQYHEHVAPNETDGWDTIVGIKLNEGTAHTVTLSDGTEVAIKGAQVQHVRYNSNGTIYSPDGVDNVATNLHVTGSNGNYHYCGESAQSISVGQIQRMNEIAAENNAAIADALSKNSTTITNIKNTYVSNVTTNQNGDTWTVVQGDGNVTIKDTYVTGVTNTFTDDGKLTTTIYQNQGKDPINSNEVNIKAWADQNYAGKTVTIGNTTIDTTTQVVNNHNAITNINQNIIGNMTDIKQDGTGTTEGNTVVSNINNIYHQLETGWNAQIDGITVNNIKMGEAQNFVTGDNMVLSNENGAIKVATKQDVIFNSVSANTIYGTTANLGTVNAGNINATTATIGTVNASTVNTGTVNADSINANIVTADKVQGNEAGFTTVNAGTVNANTVNGGTANFNTVNAGAVNTSQVGTQTIYLGTSTDYTAIKYENGSDRITYDDNVIATLDDGMKYGADKGEINALKLNDTLTVNGDKNITTVSNGKGQIAVTLNDEITVTTVNAATTNSTTVNTETVNVGDSVTINDNGITIENGDNDVIVNKNEVNVGGNKITNVQEGAVYQGSMDAVNGGQLWQTNQRLDSLGNRVDKVGAGAAALAALHPLDFDPDDKLSFSAGVGNYAGSTASAIGAFYRPDERTMFSIGGTVGNGENMVNAGVSFALGRGGHVTKSRVAMAHEINDLRAQVAELTAMVSQLASIHSNFKFDSMRPFPDTPENHWAYEYIGKLAAEGIVEGYPDGNFSGERSMTRYEFGAMLYRALQKGFAIDERLVDEFEPELGRLSVERIKGELNQKNKIERVRINDKGEDRDVYGGKITVGKTW